MAARDGWKQIIVREDTYAAIKDLKTTLEDRRGKFVALGRVVEEAVAEMKMRT